jgi:hypothetical protein
VYAGAAREAVFSVPAVIRRINADFVPLAVRAGLVNGAAGMRDEDEKWIYQRINHAKLAPQGICVLDSTGQVLTWVQMFDSNQDVLAFLEQACKRYRESAAARPPVITERYMQFPSKKMKDLRDETRIPAIAGQHPEGKVCPARTAKGAVAPGSIMAQLVGRALDDTGKPLADVVNQEHYVEDRFALAPRQQEAVAQALAKAGKDRVALPAEFARTVAAHAHLGHLDVQPCLCMIPGKAVNKGEWKQCQFWAKHEQGGKETSLWRIAGRSEVVSELAINGPGVHNVKLSWQGFITMKGPRISELLLAARGTEKLEFSRDHHPLKNVKKDEVAFLPAGRPIDVHGGVCYGIIGLPVADADAAEDTAGPLGDVPEEARQQLIKALGGPFIVFQDAVQQELKLSDEQKQMLLEKLPDHVQATMKVFEEIKDLKRAEREKRLNEHRHTADRNLSAFLSQALQARQQHRLLQLQLQQAGVFALVGENEAFAPLKITDEQRQRFMAVVQEMHKRIEPLINEAESAGNPAEIMPRIMKVRREHESRVAAILTEAQRSQWRKLLGKPFDFGR